MRTNIVSVARNYKNMIKERRLIGMSDPKI
jgi:hypothetical protein